MIKKIFLVVFKSLIFMVLSFFIFTFLYFAGAGLFSIVPTNNQFEEQKNGMNIYILSEKWHTSICFPLKDKKFVCQDNINLSDFELNRKRYISFGIGDREYYTKVENTFLDLINAIFFPTSSVVKISLMRKLPEYEKKISISKEQFEKLFGFIKNTITMNNKHMINVDGEWGGRNTRFYESVKKYHIFYTCNTWTNFALKEAGLKTSVWTPFKFGVLHNLR